MTRLPRSTLTGGRLLAHNVLWNATGHLLPLLVGVWATPSLVHGLGVERFGLLSLAWALIGYFSLFDLGLGRALTVLAADHFASDSRIPIGPMVWTALLVLLGLGGAGMFITWALATWLVSGVMQIRTDLQFEAVRSVYVLGVGIPLLTLASGLRGLLEAGQHFTAVTLIRIPIGMLMFLGPLLVLPFGRTLDSVVMTLVAARLLAAVLYLIIALRVVPSLLSGIRVDFATIRPILRLGTWMTVTNVIGPVMTYLDRFLVGAVLSLSVIAYYTAPFDVLTRLLVVPMAIVGVLFPAFAASLTTDATRASLLIARGTKYIFLSIFPVLMTVVLFGPELLELWLGTAFAENSALPLRWLAFGVLANGLAQVPFAFLQAGGRPDVTARVHAIELPFYLVGLWMLTKWFGLAGTAAAWTLRAAVDAIVLFALSHGTLAKHDRFQLKPSWAWTGALPMLLASFLPLSGGWMKGSVLIGTLSIFGWIAWRSFSVDERSFIAATLTGSR